MFLKEFYAQAFSFGIWTARKLGRGHKQSRGKRETFTAKAMDDGMGERREGGSPLRECLHLPEVVPVTRPDGVTLQSGAWGWNIKTLTN